MKTQQKLMCDFGSHQVAQPDARSRAGFKWFEVSMRAPVSLSLGTEIVVGVVGLIEIQLSV
jgi:hypothetical protein